MARHARAALLAAGLSLTTATQLRFSTVPFGVGEILLCCWIAITIGRISLNPLPAADGYRTAALFWVISAMLLLCGLTVSAIQGISDYTGAWHDGIALLLCGILFLCFTRVPLRYSDVPLAQRYLVLGLTTVLFGLLAIGRSTKSAGTLQLWMDNDIGGRFTGWSQNPNQIAIALSGVPFISIALSLETRSLIPKLAYGAMALAAIAVGIKTDSDTLVLAWVAAGIAAVVFALWKTGRSRAAPIVATLAVVITVLISYGLAAGVMDPRASFETLFNRSSQGGLGHGGMRLILWQNGLEALSTSPVVGLGPGSFSGATGPFEHSEAHNTFIDWATSTGVLGALALIALFYKAGRAALRCGDFATPLLFIAVLTLSLAHYVLRHPTYWLYLAICLTSVQLPRGKRGFVDR